MITTLSTAGLAAEVDALLADLGVARQRYTGGTLTARSPISGAVVAAVQEIDPNIARNAIDDAHSAFLPGAMAAPRRGELIQLLGEELRHA
jgi:aldehyde dehydrogenase (NAD+)